MRNRWDDEGYRNYGWRDDERGYGYGGRDWRADEAHGWRGGPWSNRGYGGYAGRGYDERYGSGYGRDYGARRDHGMGNRGYGYGYGGQGREYGMGRGGYGGYDDWRYGSDMNDSDLEYELMAIEMEPSMMRDEDRYRRFGRGGPQEPGIGQRITHGLKKAFRGPKGYKRSDERIREDVCDRLDHLAQHAEVDCGDVEVSVKDGEVILSGTVEERRHKRLLENVAEEVSGVIDVANQLRVRGREERAEQEIRRGTTTSSATTSSPANGLPRGGMTR